MMAVEKEIVLNILRPWCGAQYFGRETTWSFRLTLALHDASNKKKVGGSKQKKLMCIFSPFVFPPYLPSQIPLHKAFHFLLHLIQTHTHTLSLLPCELNNSVFQLILHFPHHIHTVFLKIYYYYYYTIPA